MAVGAEELTEDGVAACVKASLGQTIDEWVVTGGARAEGSGPSCEKKTAERDVCYSTPPSYAIHGKVEVTDKGNNAGRGSISKTLYSPQGGKPTKACVRVSAWGADGPFGAGGWQNVELAGKMIEVPTSERKSSLEAVCRNSIRSAGSNISIQP
ncbi:hypothetical protein [Rhizobium mesoamericanum]|uniref:hypothetical protein n=1 Tax=Rhizobium mesoamericanum TaxID=1079800 RepID=UPI00048A7C60|nr:hypothetical protein [Rhizobium mesoamericanum]